MITIYNPPGWIDADRLAIALRDLGAKCKVAREAPSNYIVSWGFSHPGASLNRRILGNKYAELQRFKRESVSCINASKVKVPEWVGRKLKHRSASDLIDPTGEPDYYVERMEFDLEFRVHVFKEKVIRVGMKRPKANDHHPWIRSVDLGWTVDYGKVCQAYVTDRVRDEARKAVKALEYDFGAVDVGLAGDKAVVMEVNTAPGLTWNTAMAYARHIKAHAR